jgi:hypothetical protein
LGGATETPATVWPRSVETSDDGLADFCLTLLKWYGLLACGLALLVAAEMHLGLFAGSATWEAILKATGTGLSGDVAALLM